MAGGPGDDREGGARPVRPSTGAAVDRRLLDEVFGDVLPDITDDERDQGEAAGADRERWYRDNRPPHHGD